MTRNFDTFGLTDYTDAVLNWWIYRKIRPEPEDNPKEWIEKETPEY